MTQKLEPRTVGLKPTKMGHVDRVIVHRVVTDANSASSLRGLGQLLLNFELKVKFKVSSDLSFKRRHSSRHYLHKHPYYLTSHISKHKQT